MTKNQHIPESIFGRITEEEFVREYWQKKPLFVEAAMPGFMSPLSKEGVFDLAGRDDADSRLVMEEGGEYEWEARFGPFAQDEFHELDDHHWTVLVQEVDRLHRGVRELLAAVPFLPNWRIDDVMVSYATDLGGVGAHIDQYDVFLIQGMGERKWEIMKDPVEDEELVPDLDVRILAHFDPTDTWLVRPGDLLYLPPNVAHRGTAVGESLTYSIGCRAPSRSDLINGFFEAVLGAGIDPSPFSTDAPMSRYEAGRLSPEVKRYAVDTLKEITRDTEALERWLGRFLSQPSRGYFPDPPERAYSVAGVLEALQRGSKIRATAFSQVMYDVGDEAILLFVSGEEVEFPPGQERVVDALCSRDGLSLALFPDDSAARELITSLINQGAFEIV